MISSTTSKKYFASLFCGVIVCHVAVAQSIRINLPDGMKVHEADAIATASKLETLGTVEKSVVTFTKLLPDTAYDIRLTLADGSVLRGVDMGWYSMEPAKADAGDLNDDDKKEITSVLKDVPSFYNKNDIILWYGNHDRATVLVQLIRDSAFHSDKGHEVIWHIELWYFKNQHGGWEKTQQTNRILRRERYATEADYHAEVDSLRWVPELGGLKVAKDGPDLNVTLPANAGVSGIASTPAAK